MFLTFCRENLIDTKIERAVSNMQSVIELGRVVRERKTLPIKVMTIEYIAESLLIFNTYI